MQFDPIRIINWNPFDDRCVPWKTNVIFASASLVTSWEGTQLEKATQNGAISARYEENQWILLQSDK